MSGHHAHSQEPIPAGLSGPALIWAKYVRFPLFAKILLALLVGIGVGKAMGPGAESLKPIADLVLRFLRLLATPLIFMAVVNAISETQLAGKKTAKLMWVLMTNTLVAILVGLTVANILQPGKHISLAPPKDNLADKKPYNLGEDLLNRIPGDFITAFKDNEILGVIFIAVLVGFAMRALRGKTTPAAESGLVTLSNVFQAVFQLAMTALKWVFELVPLAVFAVVARIVGTQGLDEFLKMGWFILAVLIALSIMVVWYLLRLRLSSWVRPGYFLRGGFDAFAMAFSTASSAATLPVTFRSAKEKIGVEESSASLGIMVGGTFNHDGTALYEAMAALFISQALGQNLGVQEQITVVIMSVVASVGAAGIPEAGLVTMLAVFTAVKLPTEYILLILPVDWFLDRCRTTINVMGDLASTCIVDGKTKPVPVTAETIGEPIAASD